jgi:hypothetical protein
MCLKSLNVLNTILSDNIYLWNVCGFLPHIPFSSSNKNDHHNIIKILLKVAENLFQVHLATGVNLTHNLVVIKKQLMMTKTNFSLWQ